MAKTVRVKRRQALQLLAGAGVAAPLQFAQEHSGFSVQDVRSAARIDGASLTEDRVSVLAPVLATLEQFQMVRDLDIEDGVGLPVIFISR